MKLASALTYLLSGFGEFVEANIFAILGIISSFIGLIVWLIRLEGRVNFNTARTDKIEKHTEELDDMCSAADKSNQLNGYQFHTLKERLDKTDQRINQMEITLAGGFEKTLTKIHELSEKISINNART